ncbi:MAG: hypothetical protein K940chlam9_00608 [Chlamydiae bacterium]|nr:hypothetical protein [Chlamydiota bacterium]
MDMNHCQNDSTIGKIAVYTVYNLGGSVIVGLTRTVIAIVYIAKHILLKEMYAEVYRQKEEERTSEVVEAKRRTEESTGWQKPLNFVREIGVRGQVAVEQLGDKVVHAGLTSSEEELKEMWKEELYRGLSEMIPVFGSAYWTYQDNWSKDRKVESYLGLGELAHKLEMEGAISDMAN